MVRVMGLDPGLRFTGWGTLDDDNSRLSYKGHGVISVPPALSLAERLHFLFERVCDVLREQQPNEVAVEEVFVNRNGESTLKLCMARGVVLMSPAVFGIPVFEYGANCIKKTVTGQGHADKAQVKALVEFLLPAFKQAQSKAPFKLDCSDALAIALCHAQHDSINRVVGASIRRQRMAV